MPKEIQMTYSTTTGAVVRRSGRTGPNPNGRKDHLVIRRDTHYCGELLATPTQWVAATKYVTIKQACELCLHLEKFDGVQVKLVTKKEWEAMQTSMVQA
jgi:hypothetical protein